MGELMRSRCSSLLATLAVLAALSGCGGGGGSESTASLTSGSPPAQTSTSAEQSSGPRSGAEQSPASGTAQFETKGTDNSIQESGSEAGPAELAEAATVLHAYLDARAAGSWAAACKYLAPGVTAQLAQLASQGGGEKAPGCTALLGAFSAAVPAAALREVAVADVGALRVEGESGFLLFHGAHGVDYFIPLRREGGRWKVAAIAPSPLS